MTSKHLILRSVLLLLLLASAVTQSASAQYIVGYINEYNLKGRVKQIDEFMSRFNNEEDWQGKKNSNNSVSYRVKYMRTLFDHARYPLKNGVLDNQAEQFIADVVKNNYKLHYLDSTWTASLDCKAVVNGAAMNVRLTLQTGRQGEKEYSWIISDIKGLDGNNVQLNSRIDADTVSSASLPVPIISPMEHEIGFMGLLSLVNGKKMNPSKILKKDAQTKELLALKALLRDGNIKLTSIGSVAFTFYTIPHWRFTIKRVERKNSVNTGWLINNLAKNN